MFTSDLTTPPWSERSVAEQSAVPQWMVPSSHPGEPVPSSLAKPEPHGPKRARLSTPPPPPPQPRTTSLTSPSTPPPPAVREAAAVDPQLPAANKVPSLPPRDYDGELAAMQEQLANAVRSIATIRRDVLEASERDLVKLAMVIAERVTGRELQTDPALVARWARAGIDALDSQDTTTIAVSQDIADVVPDEAWTDRDGNNVAPLVDPNLPPGSCEVRGEFSRVDASLAGRLVALGDAVGATEESD